MVVIFNIKDLKFSAEVDEMITDIDSRGKIKELNTVLNKIFYKPVTVKELDKMLTNFKTEFYGWIGEEI